MHLKHISVSVAAALILGSFAYAADTYTIDPAHTRVGFAARHFGINTVKGRFKEFTGKLVMDGEALKEATATIQVQSIDTGVEQRDDHLRTPDFFDAKSYPTITFKTKRVEPTSDGVVMIADFTMRGVTKELRLPVTLSKPIKDPWGGTRVGLETKTKLNRKDYGIKYNDVLESGVAAVGDEIEIEINAEAIKDKPGTAPAK
jgi:polyisoprenoid-binding protein YceI